MAVEDALDMISWHSRSDTGFDYLSVEEDEQAEVASTATWGLKAPRWGPPARVLVESRDNPRA